MTEVTDAEIMREAEIKFYIKILIICLVSMILGLFMMLGCYMFAPFTMFYSCLFTLGMFITGVACIVAGKMSIYTFFFREK